MQTQDTDTIVAIATAPGRGGVGILRLSGPAAEAICQSITRCLPKLRMAEFATFRDLQGKPVDSGLVLRFEAPASFTGEDVVELHGHGSPVTLAGLLEIAVQLGARLANPGEFSERAYLNGKLDLAQAEAIADLINAASSAAASAAMRSLRGDFSKLVHDLNERLLRLRVQIEAAIDFVDEDIELLADPLIAQAITKLGGDIANIIGQARTGVRLSEGAKLVLLGAPNVGKSSLLNRLCGDDRAIVSELPGTTRDLLREQISLAGIPIELIDTAGLRSSANQIEAEGIRRAQAQAVEADLVLAVYAVNEPAGRAFAANFFAEAALGHKVVWVANKVDLRTGRLAGHQGESDLCVSALTGEGIATLTERLVDTLGVGDPMAAGVFSARSRHLLALQDTASAITSARAGIDAGIGAELVAEQLRYAQDALGSICGEVSSDELLGEIFASFCVGK